MMNKDNTQKTAPSAVFVNIEEIAAIIREQVARGQSVEMPPRGTSMLPLIREGRDSVILSPVSGRLKKYDIPFYRRHDGTYVLHRVVGFDREGYVLCGDNQFVLEHGIGDGEIIAVVTAIRRGGKLIRLDGLLYRTYVRLWDITRWPRWVAVRAARKIKRIFTKH